MSKIAFLLGKDFEDTEFQGPFDALRKAGHQIDILGTEDGVILDGKKGQHRATVDAAAGDRKATDYDAVVIPGGHSPDNLRTDKGVVGFVRDFVATGRTIAAICHGPQLLIEVDALRGKRIASWPSIRKDVENAGATWIDEAVVIDGSLITSRNPQDVPSFNAALLQRLEDVSGRVHA